MRTALMVGVISGFCAGFLWLAIGVCQEVPSTPGAVVAPTGILERRAALVLKVPDYGRAQQEALNTAAAGGASITGGRTEVNSKGKKHGWVEIQATASEFGTLSAKLETLGTLYSDQITTSSHSSEYEELERRIGKLREHERRLLDLLSSPRLRGSDILFIQDRVFRSGIDEVILRQRRADLERMEQTGDISVELFEPGAAPGPPARVFNPAQAFEGGIARARNSLARSISRAATASAFIVIFAPLWIPLLASVILIARWLFRRVVPALAAAMLELLPSLFSRVRNRMTLMGSVLASRQSSPGRSSDETGD